MNVVVRTPRKESSNIKFGRANFFPQKTGASPRIRIPRMLAVHHVSTDVLRSLASRFRSPEELNPDNADIFLF